MEKTPCWIKLLCAVLIPVSMCFPQARKTQQRTAPTRAPFLQQAKLYEETPFVTKVVFKNGIKILVNEFHSQPVVSLLAYVHAGFSDERTQSPGLASLLSAMIFRGTSDKSAGTFRQNAETMGGSFKRSTGYDKTLFEIVAPSSQWKKALDMLADALLNPTFEQETLGLEANLVLDEARAAMDGSAEFADEKLLEMGFDQPRMGKFDSMAGGALRDYTKENLLAFYRAMYSPAEITLVVSGDVSSSDILNEAAKVYNKPSGPVAKHVPMPVETVQKGFRYRAVRGDIPVPRLLFGFHVPSENAEDYRALEVLNAILGVGEGSVFITRLRDQKKLILGEETSLVAYPDFGYLSIQMDVAPPNIDKSEIAVLTEIELLKREAPGEADIARAFAQLERSYWKRLETVTGRAQNLARFESLGDWRRMDRYVSELRQVKPADVKRVASRYLNLQNCSLLEYLPASGEERNLTADIVLRTLEELIGPSTDQEQAARDKEVVLALNLPSPGGSFKPSEIRYPFQIASILRGPDLFIREDHTAPLIDMGLFFPGGKSAEKKENSGITDFMVNLMLQGTVEKSSAQFHRQMEIYGGKVIPVVADDYFGFYFSILARNFESGFDLLLEAIKTSGFDKDQISRQKEIQSARILFRRNSVSYPKHLVDQALFGDFSYSLDSVGTEEGLAAITPDSLQSWYDAYVKNRKPVVAAIGDTKGTSLASYFVKNFSGSRIQEAKLPEETVKPLGKGVTVENKWSKSQSLILIGFQAPPEDDEDLYAAMVLQSYSGTLGRFSQEMRDQLGLADSVSAAYEPRLRGGGMIICVSANPSREEAVLKSLRQEIQRVTAEPITYRDFRSALNAAIGAYEIRNQVRSVQISDLVETILAGKGLEAYQKLRDSLQGVNEDDLKDVARRIYNLDKAVILRVHGQQQ